MKCIKINTCKECPYCHHDDGGGHCSAFVNCAKFGIMLFDWGGPENFDINSGIHPDCRLDDYENRLKGE